MLLAYLLANRTMAGWADGGQSLPVVPVKVGGMDSGEDGSEARDAGLKGGGSDG